MSGLIENEISSPASVFYGLHFFPGIAEYRKPGEDPYRVLINQETISAMNDSFRGKPVYVGHVDGQEDYSKADGWVIESFFLPCDGHTWCRFIVTSDEAKAAIKNGNRLSNAYTPRAFKQGGLWHGADYYKEVVSAEYDHLAIIPDPRYAESIILSPEQFKQYVDKKTAELAQVANSADEQIHINEGENTMAFWKKTKVENSLELESTMVDLPKSKTQCDLKTLINEMDDYRLEMKLPKMANDDHHVQVGEGDGSRKMSVKELKDAYCNAMKDMEEMKKKNDSESMERDAVSEEKKMEMKGKDGESGKDKAKNASADEMERESVEEEKKKELKAENEKEDEDKKKKDEEMKNQLKLFNELKNAHLNPIREERTPDLDCDRLSRGKSRYGSAN